MPYASGAFLFPVTGGVMPFARKEDHNAYIKGYLKRRYDERWPIAVKMLGGRCVECGATERLEFDHIDPRSKRFEIADKLAQYAWPHIMVELAKCQLLCNTCHIAKSRGGVAATRRRLTAASTRWLYAPAGSSPTHAP